MEIWPHFKIETKNIFKEDFCTEPYVKYCMSRKKRSILAQFRLGILPLNIETGRFRNISVNERICKFCVDNVIEDEMHFLCCCNVYADARKILYDSVESRCTHFGNMNNVEKLVYLMKHVWKETGIYLEKAWSIRNGLMYR